jgi:hypothetical protein
LYNELFTASEPSDLWEDELNNPESDILYTKAMIDPSVRGVVDYKSIDKWQSNVPLQFECMGYFVVDCDTTYDPDTNRGLLVFIPTVSLKVEVFQKKLTVNEQAKIDNLREQDAKDLEIKEARMKIDEGEPLRNREYSVLLGPDEETNALKQEVAALSEGLSTPELDCVALHATLFFLNALTHFLFLMLFYYVLQGDWHANLPVQYI